MPRLPRAPALAVSAALLVLLLGPLAAGSPPASCAEAMLTELGWAEDAGSDLLLQPSVDSHPCTGKIQPGAQLTSGCTMNFIFRDTAGALYFGTAGHCTGDGEVLGVVGVGGAVATVVYDGCPPSSCATDFALARIDPAYYPAVDPTVCHWGGPSGVNTAPRAGQTTHGYGFGSLYKILPDTRARMGAVVAASAGSVTYLGFAQPGDSGAPLVTGDGRALGVHVVSTLGASGIRVDPSLKVATRLDAAMLRAEQATGLDLDLVQGLSPFHLLGT